MSNDRVGRVDGSGGESDSKSVSTRRLDANLTGVSLGGRAGKSRTGRKTTKVLANKGSKAALSTTELPTTVMLDLVKAELAKFLTWSMVTGL